MCLNPVLSEIPEGDWFCPVCEHQKLCKILLEKLEVAEKHFKQLEMAKNQSIMKRTNRYNFSLVGHFFSSGWGGV